MSLLTSRMFLFLPVPLRIALRELARPTVGLWCLLVTLVFAITVLSLAVGLTESVRTATRQSAQQTIGGDISLRLFHRAPTDREIAHLRRFGILSLTAEQRVMVEAPNHRPILGELKAVDDAYPLYGRPGLSDDRLLNDALASQNDVFGAVVAPELLDQLGLAIGEHITIGRARFVIRATLLAEPERTFRLFSLGPRILISTDAYRRTGLATPNRQLYWYARLKLDPAQNSRDVINAINAAFPDSGWRIVNADDGIPGIERLSDFANAFVSLTGIAIFIIALGAMRNALAADLEARHPRFALWRSLGVADRQLITTIATQIGLLVVMALLIGNLAAFALGQVLAAGTGEMLGLALPYHPAHGGWIALFVLIFMAVIASGPVGQACLTSPARLFRHQTQHHGNHTPRRWPRWMFQATGIVALGAIAVPLVGLGWLSLLLIAVLIVCLALFAGLALAIRLAARKLGSLCTPHAPSLRLALRNIARPGAPTFAMITSVGLATSCLMAVLLFGTFAGQHLTSTLPDRTPDLVFFDIPPERQSAFERHARSLPDVTAVTSMPFLHGRITHINATPIHRIDIPARLNWFIRGDRGLSWATRPHPAVRDNPVVQGDWWPDTEGGLPQASLDATVARGLGLDIGDRITLNLLGQGYDAEIANLRRIDWTQLQLDFPIVLSRLPAELPFGFVSSLDLGTAAMRAKVANDLATAFPTLPMIEIPEILARLTALFDGVITGAFILTLLATLGAGFVVISGLIALRQQANHNLVMLCALGIRPKQLRASGAWETGLTVGIAALFGTVTGTMLALAGASAIGAEVPAFPLTVAIGPLVLVILVGFALGWMMQARALHRSSGWRP